MKIYSISLILLLFHTNVFGYSISTSIANLEDEMKQNETEVYEIQEGNGKSVKLIYPKADKPTLREIIYFHVIETPFQDEKKAIDEGPDFDDTRRPFTNSHGLPFIKDEAQIEEEVETDEETLGQTDEDLVEETESVETEVDNKLNDEASNITPHQETTEIGESIEQYLEEELDERKNDKDVESDSAKAIEEDVQETEHTIHHSETTTTEQFPEDLYTTAKDDVVEEKKNARNLLFGQVKKRYQDIRRPSTPIKLKPRQRRNADHIPEAPKLEEMNYDGLPEDIRRLISTPKPEKQEETHHKETKHFNDQELKAELKDKIELMFSKLKSTYDDVIEEGDDGGRFDSTEYLKPRTYGMNLTKDHGHVWNDLFVDPGMSFEVGDKPAKSDEHESSEVNHEDSDQVEDVSDSDETHDNEEDEYEHTHYVIHPTESRPLTNQDNNKNEETTDKEDSQESADKNGEFEDIFINKSKTLLEDTSTEEEKKQQKQAKAVTPFETEKELVETSTEREIAIPKHTEEDNEKEIDHRTEDLKIKEKDRFSNHPDLLNELMKNEQFWKWLSEWTDTYMELLIKHIKQLVHEEVARQIKKYGKELKNEILEEHEKLFDEKRKLKDEEREKLKGKKEKDDTDKIHHKKDKKESKKIKDSNEKAGKDSKKAHKKNNVDEIEKLEPTMKDNKLIIDGIEFPITHNSNFKNGDSKDHSKHNKEEKHKHKEDKDRNKESDATPIKKDEQHKASAPISTIAHNIFGNSVGSNKVTNVYIFMQPEDEEDEEFEEIGDGEFITDKFDENSDIDIDHRFKPDISQQKDKEIVIESKSTTPQTDVQDKYSQTDNKDEKDKKEPKTDEIENKEKETEDSNKKEEKTTTSENKDEKDTKEPKTDEIENKEKETEDSSKKEEKLTTSEKPLETTDKPTTEKTQELKNKDEKEANKSEKGNRSEQEGNESDKEVNKLEKEVKEIKEDEKNDEQNEKTEISDKTEKVEPQESKTEKHEDK